MWGRLAVGDRGGGGGSGEKRGGWAGAGMGGEKWSEDDERGEEAGHSDGGGAEVGEAGGGWGMGECEHARVLVGRMEVDEKYLAVLERSPGPHSPALGGVVLPRSYKSRVASRE